MNNITAEATRVTIQHGGFELEVFQLCDESLWEQYGQYRLSQTQVLERIDEAANWITRLHSDRPIILKALQGEGFTGIQLKVKFKEEGSRGWKTAKTLSISDSTEVWWHFSFDGNKKAKAILKASTEETIERRADAKFGQIRTEQEYEQRTADRILDNPEPWSPMFEEAFEIHLERITGLHKCHIRNSQFYWEFIYRWLTVEERAKLDEINPVLPGGRRRHKIHTCIEQSTKDRLRGHIQTIYALMRSANSIAELRRMVQRQDGFDQGDLFDGWAA